MEHSNTATTPNRRRLLVLGSLVALQLVLVLALHGIQGQKESKTRRTTEKGGMDEQVKASFFRETALGRDIIAYLHCIDFECSRVRAEVAKAGTSATAPLLYLLRNGIPQELRKGAHGDLRPRIVNLLGTIGDTRAVPDLVGLLQDTDPVVRATAAGALGQIRTDSAVEPLLSLLQDPDQLVRETCAIALGRLGRPDALPALRKAAQLETKAHVRKAMQDAIRLLEER